MVDEIECRARRWGSSIGIVIPNNIVEQERIKPDDKIMIKVQKMMKAKELWNIRAPKDNRPIAEIIKELKSGW